MKLKFNKKFLLLILAVFLVFFVTGLYLIKSKKTDKLDSSSFKGVIKTGEQLGNFKNYCSEGLYLVTDDGSNMADQVKGMLTVELSAGQMVEDVRLAVNGRVPVEFYGRMGGIVPSPDEVLRALKEKILGK